jgi:succinoglycan biosynthesis protein ExoA
MTLGTPRARPVPPPPKTGEWPYVSVIIPCRNEARYIDAMLSSVMDTDYPADRLEVIVADGLSSDGTRALLEAACLRDPRIRLIDNPLVHKPHALNAAIAAAKGAVIVRMDAHSTYPPDYLSECVRALMDFGADNVGGIQAAVPTVNSPTARAICDFYSSRLGFRRSRSSNAARTPTIAATVYCGCFRREVFTQYGLFDTRLLRGQDRELNARIRAKGGLVLLLPWVQATYHPRTSLVTHGRYMLLSGLVPFRVQSKVATPVLGLRNVFAALVALAALTMAVLSLAVPAIAAASLLCAVVYSLLLLTSGVALAVRRQSLTAGVLYPLICSISHVMYGLGAAWGFAEFLHLGLRRLALGASASQIDEPAAKGCS